MLAKKNKDIKKAYDLLQIISKDEKSRMLYEARQAEISDQLTRLKSAEEKGIEKGIEEVVTEMLLNGEPVDKIKKYSKLSEEEITKLKNKLFPN